MSKSSGNNELARKRGTSFSGTGISGSFRGEIALAGPERLPAASFGSRVAAAAVAPRLRHSGSPCDKPAPALWSTRRARDARIPHQNVLDTLAQAASKPRAASTHTGEINQAAAAKDEDRQAPTKQT